MHFLMLFIGPCSELLAANIAGHLPSVGQPLVFGQRRLVASGIATLVTLILNTQMFVLHMALQSVRSRCGEMTLITWDTVTARLVPVQIVTLHFLGKHRGVLTVLTPVLLGPVDAFNVPVQLRPGLGLERTFVAGVVLV